MLYSIAENNNGISRQTMVLDEPQPDGILFAQKCKRIFQAYSERSCK